MFQSPVSLIFLFFRLSKVTVMVDKIIPHASFNAGCCIVVVVVDVGGGAGSGEGGVVVTVAIVVFVVIINVVVSVHCLIVVLGWDRYSFQG